MRTYSHIHRGPFIQQGRGLGGILAALGRTLVPILRTGVATAGKKIVSSPTLRNTVVDLGRSAIDSGIKHSLSKSSSTSNPSCKRKKKPKQHIKEIISSIRKRKSSASTTGPKTKKKKKKKTWKKPSRGNKYPIGLLDD